MMAYIQNNLVYPQVAIENGIQGKCYLKFVVSVDGSISQVTVVRGVVGCKECDNAALKVVKSMPAWKPGKNNGRSVASWFQLPINFTLE
jgi:TonB family protein